MASDTRDRILSVAARLFEARGFEGTAVAAILREADVNSGSLYHFFPSKEVLLVAVLQKYLAVLDPALLVAAERAADDPLEKIFALLELYRGRLLVSEFTRGCPVGDLSLEIAGRFPEARRLVRDYFEAWTDRVEEWLEAAGDLVPTRTDRRALASHILSVLQGGIMQARVTSSIEPFDDSVSHLRLLMDLLGAGELTSPFRQYRQRPPVGGKSASMRDAAAGALAAAGSASRTADPVDPTTGEAVGLDDAAWWKAW